MNDFLKTNRYDGSLDAHSYPFGEVGTVRVDNKVVHVLKDRGREGVLAMANIMHRETKLLVDEHVKKLKTLKTPTPKSLPHEDPPKVSILVDEHGFERVVREPIMGNVFHYVCPYSTSKAALRLEFERIGGDRRTVDGVVQNVMMWGQVRTSSSRSLPAPVPKWQHTDEQVAYGLFKIDPRVVAFVERVSEVPAYSAISPKGELMVQRVREDMMEPFFKKAWERGGGGEKGNVQPTGKDEAQWVSDAYGQMHSLTRILSRNIK